jgi:hypothetical protein
MRSSSISRYSITASAVTQRSACLHQSSSRLVIRPRQSRDSRNATPRNPGHPRASIKVSAVQTSKDQYQCVKASGKKCLKWAWTHYRDIGHSIAVVGYDQNNYYYIDTCQLHDPYGLTKCSWLDRPASGTWPVSKGLLYTEMQRQGDGFAYYLGPASIWRKGY